MSATVPMLLLLAGGLVAAQPAPAGELCLAEAGCVEDSEAARTFRLADERSARGDLEGAKAALRSLTHHPVEPIRSEARFRLAMLLASAREPAEAAVLFRQILDDNPGAQRVRLELARQLELIGDESGARRALSEAQAGRLPPRIAELVQFYSAALRARKPLGATLELALAPDTNINQATQSSSLGTVFGDLLLDRDARRQSGVGFAVRGQAYARRLVREEISLLGKLSLSADLYRKSRFNDVSLGLSAGPEFGLAGGRAAAELGAVQRFHGGQAYSRLVQLGATFARPAGRQAQVRLAATAGIIDNRRNDLQDGRLYSLSLGYERALSVRSGAGVIIAGERQGLRDPGYSTLAAQASLFGYHDIGAVTVFGSAGYGLLEADERLVLYPRRRSERQYRLTAGATWRKLRLGSFAPLLRVAFERNESSVGLFDYRRTRTELGLTRAF